MATVKIKPIEGATVYYPGTHTAVPAAGDTVELDTYWQRRINDGSITVEPAVEPIVETRAEQESAKHISRRGRE